MTPPEVLEPHATPVRSAAEAQSGHGLPPELLAAVVDEFGGVPRAVEVVARFLGTHEEGPAPASWFLRLARRGGDAAWELRRAAALMAESLVLASDDDSRLALLREIAEDPTSGLTMPPGEAVLAEGYTRTDPVGFARELRTRLARHDRVHRRICGPETKADALREFFAIARDECRITLGRYCFSPHETARRVLDRVRASRGFPAPHEDEISAGEAAEALSALPGYERTILEELTEDAAVLWSCPATPSRINGLVEHPAGTVVLVVKPPGSGLEIEIKRTGLGVGQPLSVVYERGGVPVPQAHRLYGGSMGVSLRTESVAAAWLLRAYRLIHGEPSPTSLPIERRLIHEIPCEGGAAHPLEYFSVRERFGPGFDAMREAMGRSVEAFSREWRSAPVESTDDLARTVAFLGMTVPSQSTIVGTSSFRIDRVAALLEPTRADHARPGRRDAAEMAATLMDEALGGFQGVTPREGVDPAAEILASPSNRARADDVFLDLCSQAGKFWGTTNGLGAHSMGESFVARNVGLRSVWEAGAWRVRLLFMDHDNLRTPSRHHDLLLAIRGGYYDAAHLMLSPPAGRRSVLDLLSEIYRVDEDVARRGRASCIRQGRCAFDQARAALAGDEAVRALYDDGSRASVLAWQEAAAAILSSRRAGLDLPASAEVGARILRGGGTPSATVDALLKDIETTGQFLDAVAPLFDPEAPGEDDRRGPR